MVSRRANGARMPDPAIVGDTGDPVLLDCASCAVRGTGCSDCVVALLLGPPEPLAVDDGQVRALAVLAGCGLVPPLRHLPVLRHQPAGRPA
jgi:hypothetical protein